MMKVSQPGIAKIMANQYRKVRMESCPYARMAGVRDEHERPAGRQSSLDARRSAGEWVAGWGRRFGQERDGVRVHDSFARAPAGVRQKKPCSFMSDGTAVMGNTGR